LMDYETIIVERKGHVATVTLNRPRKLNALNPRMKQELWEALPALDQDDGVRVVVLTGAGRAFCAGADIEEMFLGWVQDERRVGEAVAEYAEEESLILAKMKTPVIAAVNGPSVGWGCTVTLPCDIRIASESATFSFPFIRMGILPDFGATYFLPRLIGMGKTCELVYTARTVSSHEAREIGLVDRVVPPDELAGAAHETAAEIAAMPPLALYSCKRALFDGANESLGNQLLREALAHSILLRTEDHEEAARAFMEKREPFFKGR